MHQLKPGAFFYSFSILKIGLVDCTFTKFSRVLYRSLFFKSGFGF